jgi:hypothetical protein
MMIPASYSCCHAPGLLRTLKRPHVMREWLNRIHCSLLFYDVNQTSSDVCFAWQHCKEKEYFCGFTRKLNTNRHWLNCSWRYQREQFDYIPLGCLLLPLLLKRLGEGDNGRPACGLFE